MWNERTVLFQLMLYSVLGIGPGVGETPWIWPRNPEICALVPNCPMALTDLESSPKVVTGPGEKLDQVKTLDWKERITWSFRGLLGARRGL